MKSYMVSIFLVQFESILFCSIFFIRSKATQLNSPFDKEKGEKSRDQVIGENKMN